MINMERLEKALLPYEKRLKSQERFRKFLGVKEVERPTYERYITGPIERFEKERMAFLALRPGNPHGKKIRKKFETRTGYDRKLLTLPFEELEAEDRIARSISKAINRACVDYEPEPFPVTPPEGRLEVDDEAWMSRMIKKIGLMLGADIVRITKLDQRWVYKDVNIAHKYAIICAVQHKPSFLDLAPSFFAQTSGGDAYSRLKIITTQLADFIRGLGYDAMYSETRGSQVSGDPELIMVPIALDAGIGEFCRTGRVLSPEYGNNMRLKAVTTNLPLLTDKPISFGTHEFCMACESCAKYCPPGAIPKGAPSEQMPNPVHNNPGFKKWYINAEKCLIFWGMNRKKWINCGGRCMAVCPWNKPINLFHNFVRWTAIHAPNFLKKLLVWGDEVVYNRKTKIDK